MVPDTNTEKVVKFPADLDYEEAAEYFADVVSEGYTNLLVDMFDTKYLVSRQVSVLVMLHKEVKTLGGKICLINVNEDVYRIFDILNLDRIMPIERLSDSNPKKTN